MDRSRHLSLVVVAAPLLVGLSSFAACKGGEPAGGDSLRRDFPTRAGEVLGSSRAFDPASGGGFRARASRGVEVTLPANGEGEIVFTMASGGTIRVHEDHVSGAAARDESAVKYARAGGASYWSLQERGVEEWLALEADAVVAGEPAASWTIEGGRFVEIGDTVAVVDQAGRAMLRVDAPHAYGADGRAIAVDLEVSGDRLALRVDAAGERVLVDPLWSDAGDMTTPRSEHVALLLDDGRVLVAGGRANGPTTGTVEAYDPTTNLWTSRASMPLALLGMAGAHLPNGNIATFGGFNGDPVLFAFEYDVAGNTWSGLASMQNSRSGATATELAFGTILVFGGNFSSAGEVYDPALDSWMVTGFAQTGRSFHTATRLLDGRVLLTGGSPGSEPTSSCELFDPVDFSFASTGGLNLARARHGAALLPDGRVLVAGGDDIGATSAEIYDPSGGSWTTVAPMAIGRYRHTLTALLDGTVVAIGGSPDAAGTTATATVEFYDPVADTWTADTSMVEGRNDHTATLLFDGNVLAAGGFNGASRTTSAERYLSEAPPLPDGALCQLGSECASTFCTDGVCCQNACNGACQSCGGQGICGADEDFSLCNGGTCQNGSCIPDPLPDGELCSFGGQCGSGFCTDGVCCNEFCFGDCNACSVAAGATVNGICEATVGAPCDNPFNCADDDVCSSDGVCIADSPICPITECLEDSFCGKGSCFDTPLDDGTGCSNGGACQGGVCIPAELFPDGDDCVDGAQCLSGNCVDDVCCNGTCVGECIACSTGEGADEDGICGPITDGALCGKGGSCSDGACSTPLPNGASCQLEAECDSGNCVDDVCCNTACAGACVACSVDAGSGTDGTCQPVQDGTECAGGACSGGLCVIDSPKGLGEACDSATECGSARCVDGVCCNAACDGDCDACSTDEGADENGTCSNATGRSCDDGNACTRTDVCQDQSCAGSDVVECTPGACQVASSCSEDTGACVAVSTPDGAPCEGGVCIAGACQTDPDVGSLSGSGTANGAGPGGTGSGSGPSGTASGPSGATGAGAGSGSDDEGDAGDAESGGGCRIVGNGGSKRAAADLAWLAIAAAVGARWRGRRPTQRRAGAEAGGEGARVQP